MLGHWVGVAAAALLALSLVIGQLQLLVSAIILDVAALGVAWRWGIASKARLISWLTLGGGVVWMFVLLTARFFGPQVIG